MTALLDIDQLRTFIAIAETGSFTKAADVVNKTQSAVSMQMKRLEERLERPIFARDGRASKLTEDGAAPARLRAPHRQAQRRDARRLLRRRTVRPRAARRAGRLCRPLSARDHGALLARLSRRRADRDVRAVGRSARAHRRQRDRSRHRHQLRQQARLGNLPPRAAAVGDLEPAFDPYRGARCRSRSAGRAAAGGASRSSGWNRSAGPTACSIRARTPARSPPPCSPDLRYRCCRNRACAPACACSPPAEGFPELPSCRIGLVRNAHESSALADALAEHIVSSLDNLSEAQAAE